MDKKNNETPHDRFIRLAEKRTNNIINTIRILGNLSDKSRYEYTSAEINQVFRAIRKQLDTVENKFNVSNEKFILK